MYHIKQNHHFFFCIIVPLISHQKISFGSIIFCIIQHPIVSVWYYHMPFFSNVETQVSHIVFVWFCFLIIFCLTILLPYFTLSPLSTQCISNWTLHIAYCIISSAQCTLQTNTLNTTKTHCTLPRHIAHCKLFTTNFTLQTDHCTIISYVPSNYVL